MPDVIGHLEGGEEEFDKAGLAVVGEEGGFRDPDVVGWQGRALGAFPEIEIRVDRPVRQLVLDARSKGAEAE